MNSFSSLRLPPSVLHSVSQLGFETPTPIQAKAIPVAMSGRDVVGCAQTGTGKTAAFCLPIYSLLLSDPTSMALVLVPTRELAKQIEDFWLKLTHGKKGLTSASLIGGVPMNPQIRALSRRPALVIATPGRLIDHLERRTINVSKTSILVLDEADRMLDMGFEPQLSRIAKFVPRDRQTLLFSATFPPEAEKLSAKFVRNPERVTVGEVSRATDQVTQSLLQTEVARKNELLLDEVNRRNDGSILVFARTQSRTDRVFRYLSEYGVNAARLHGGRSQGQRNAALSAFRSGQARVMVATDIAARGLDVLKVGYVINYDLPMVPEDYVHRIGRTGRAGAQGEAVSLITREDRQLWQDIVKLLRKTGSPVPVLPTGQQQVQQPRPQPQRPQRPQGQQQAQQQPQHEQRRDRPHHKKRWRFKSRRQQQPGSSSRAF